MGNQQAAYGQGDYSNGYSSNYSSPSAASNYSSPSAASNYSSPSAASNYSSPSAASNYSSPSAASNYQSAFATPGYNTSQNNYGFGFPMPGQAIPTSGLVPAMASPEPFASWIDVMVAAQYIEKSIHASDSITCQQDIQNALVYLGYASKYLRDAGLPQYQARVDSVIQCYQGLLSRIPQISTSQFGQFQSGALYDTMGSLSALAQHLMAAIAQNIGTIPSNPCLGGATPNIPSKQPIMGPSGSNAMAGYVYGNQYGS